MRRQQVTYPSDWKEEELSWEELTKRQRQIAEQVYIKLLQNEWTTWAARKEAKVRALKEAP